MNNRHGHECMLYVVVNTAVVVAFNSYRYNTRLFKTSDGVYHLRQAAAESTASPPEVWDGHSIIVRHLNSMIL